MVEEVEEDIMLHHLLHSLMEEVLCMVGEVVDVELALHLLMLQ
jgi:hypothetical protein